MSNKITVNFVPCQNHPAKGYFVFYKESGAASYVQAGPFYSTPAIFYDPAPIGTCYEGYIVADCGNDVLGNHIPFETCASSAVVTDNSSCGTTLEQETTDLHYVNVGLFDLHVDGASSVILSYHALDRPNRFTAYEDGFEIATSGWKGYAPYPGPWGTSGISTSETGSLAFPIIPGRVYQVRVEAGPAGPPPYDVSDNFTLTVICR